MPANIPTSSYMPLAILRRKQLEARTGLARSTVYDRINPKSPRYDPTFPKPIDLGGGRAVGWIEAEVDAWIQQQISQRTEHEARGAV